MTISEFQHKIEEIYFARDSERGRDRTFLWFIEEVGELAKAMARPCPDGGRNLREEFADVLAWLATLASIEGISLEEAAVEKYGAGCPKCGGKPCRC
ncbi:MAG: nucleotide pyrophosphohydrolase [Planctomycetes bacterium]|nr:nucleotide pyrophosphohydrolase [Planctomycetota bacterium]